MKKIRINTVFLLFILCVLCVLCGYKNKFSVSSVAKNSVAKIHINR